LKNNDIATQIILIDMNKVLFVDLKKLLYVHEELLVKCVRNNFKFSRVATSSIKLDIS